MAKLNGYYWSNDPKAKPDIVEVNGSEDELRTIREKLPNAEASRWQPNEISGDYIQVPPLSRHAYYPAHKPIVETIAKSVEIECNDQRLIDWMKQP